MGEQGEKDIVLVVDDDQSNLLLAHKILAGEFRIATANSGLAALKYLRGHRPSLILLDINMPQMSGFEVMQELKKNREVNTVPVICLTADNSIDTEVKCLQYGAIDYITKPFIAEVLLSRVRRALELAHYRESLESMVAVKTQQVERITLQAITAIANTIDAKDEYTKGHSVRVAEYSARIARELGWSPDEIQKMKYIALLHDIGKIGVPDAVLNKPGRLTNIEFQLIKSHTWVGGEILKDVTMIEHVTDGAKYHHERYDGSGYPENLTGKEIPVHARIISIADTYDAMNSNRIYRSMMSEGKILQELVNGRGTQFDPDMLDIFLKLLEEGEIQRLTDELAEDSHLVPPERVEPDLPDNTLDDLTGLLTKKAGENRILAEIAREAGALALIDIDSLRKVNDTYGHLAGDYAIKAVSTVLAGQQDMISARYGGDEFICYISLGSQEAVRQKIDAVLELFREQKNGKTQLAEISLSVGVCMCRIGETYEQILRNADRALYYTKQLGKGGCHFYTETDYSGFSEYSVDLQLLLGTLQEQQEPSSELGGTELLKICRYIRQLWGRSHEPIRMVMLTLRSNGLRSEDDLKKQQIMKYVNTAICESIRDIDIFMRFSSDQYLILLKDTTVEFIDKMIQQISQAFYKTYTDGDAEITCDVTEFRGR